MLVTPLRDGMNLIAKEYVASRADGTALILSEMAGAASELGEAVMVNPNDIPGIARSLKTVLEMPLDLKGEQDGFLPTFPAWNSDTAEMDGDHEVTIIGDAYLKGIRGFDIQEAYRLMRKNALESPASEAEYLDGKGRRALDSYLKYGYIPLEDSVPGAPFRTGTSRFRAHSIMAYHDFVLAEVAKALGKSDDDEMFRKRAQNYRNVIDPATGFARGRHADGSWITPFDPTQSATYVTEGLPFQYTFFVLQDIPGLITLEHGNSGFISKLDELFAKNLYDQGNEPSHQIAYLYDYAGAAFKTQKHVAEERAEGYKDEPGGLAGNDDAGQMSAWYILSALGFYQVTPGNSAICDWISAVSGCEDSFAQWQGVSHCRPS